MYQRLSAFVIAISMSLAATTVRGQGIPVIDTSAIAKHIESITQLTKQLETMKQQLDQARQLHGSLNKLTDMADVASLLNDPEIRKALPGSFSDIEGLFKGAASGAPGEAATRFLSGNSTYRTSANDFYAQELARVQNRNAGQMGLGQQIYDAATKRLDGIDQLRKKIATAVDAKDVADLQARLQAEAAFLQTDALRMQGLQMVQQAQIQIDQQRQAEDWRKRLDTMGEALK